MPGKAVEDTGIEATDVDPELERGGGDDGLHCAHRRARLDLSAFFGEVAASVGADGVVELVGEQVAYVSRRPARCPLRLRQNAMVRCPDSDQARDHRRGLGVTRSCECPTRRRAPAGRAGRTGGALGASRRRRPGGDGQPAEVGRQALGLADGGGGEREGRVGAVVRTHAPEAAQQVREVGAEDAAEDVELVDHDIAESPEEGVPPAVVGEDAGVEHLGVREHHVGVRSDPAPIGAVRCRRRMSRPPRSGKASSPNERS